MSRPRFFVSTAVLAFGMSVIACHSQLRLRHSERPREFSLRLDDDGLSMTWGRRFHGDSLQAGAARVDITPTITDTWENHDQQPKHYDPDQGDTFEDRDGNGRFDAVWMAGYQEHKPARGVRDPLYASAMVLASGDVKVAIVSLDLIGFFASEIPDIKKLLPADLRLDALIPCATHTHAGPDTLGIWGPPGRSGVDPDYQEMLHAKIAQAIVEADDALTPVAGSVATRRFPDLIVDFRPPLVVDDALTVLRLRDRKRGRVVATLVNWSNHPDILAHDNFLVSSDFVGEFRKAWEEGFVAGKERFPAQGGVTVYINGAIGIQIEPTEAPLFGVDGVSRSTKADGDRCRFFGEHLAKACHQAMEHAEELPSFGELVVVEHEFRFRLDNPGYQEAGKAGIIRRDFSDGWVHSKVGYLRWGPWEAVTAPGEIAPEIIVGGIENPQGADFEIAPLETPPIKHFLRAPYPMIFGLGYDELGYLIPKSEWDNDDEGPFLYDNKDSWYGEQNSCGPQAGPAAYRAMRQVIEKGQARPPQAKPRGTADGRK